MSITSIQACHHLCTKWKNSSEASGYEDMLSAMKQTGSTKNSKTNLYVTYGHMVFSVINMLLGAELQIATSLLVHRF
jgi:hypothetical protein